MTVSKNFIAPAIPVPPVEYDQRYSTDLIRVLRLYFNQLDNFLAIATIPEFGSTADRPTTNLAIGQQYFDTDLGTTGIPIWWDGSDWVDATGAVV
jgi:hypothetical protein